MNILDRNWNNGNCVAGISGLGQPHPKTDFTSAKPHLKYKLDKIAELFECDVLSEEEALQACKVAIRQHAKTQDKTGRAE